MNENIDLTKILDGCPAGTEFYHSEYGRVYFLYINTNYVYSIRFTTFNDSKESGVTCEGICNIYYNGECVFFPSKDQRDWSKFVRFWDKPEVKRFDQKTWKSGDEVLFRLGETTPWRYSLFSHMFSDDFGHEVVYTTDGLALLCIPYNDETKHLRGTTDDCPDYYKWWKEERFFEDL